MRDVVESDDDSSERLEGTPAVDWDMFVYRVADGL